MKPATSLSTQKAWLSTKRVEGFSLVEVILSGALFALILTALVGAYLYGQESTVLSGNRVRAVFLAEEALEAARNIRDDDFVNLTDGTHGLAISGNIWTLSGSSDVTDIFTRELIISTVDGDRKSLTANVTWQQNQQRSGSVSLVTRLTNWLATTASNAWVTPTQESSLNFSGNNDGRKIDVQGDYAYVVRAGGNPDFVVIDISTPASPSQVGSLALSGSPQNISVSGNYAYVVSGSNSQELQIIDVSTPASPSQVGTYNAPGNANGIGVFASGTTVYFVRASSGQDEFVIIDASTPASPSLVGSLDLAQRGNEVIVIGTNAFVASHDNSEELKVIDISTPASPTSAGSLNLTGNSNALTITGISNTVIVGRASGDVTLIDVTTPASPSTISTFDALDVVNDVSLDSANDYIFVASNENSAEFQVVDISTPATPVLRGSINFSGDFNGIVYDSASDRAYAVGDTNAEEYVSFAPE